MKIKIPIPVIAALTMASLGGVVMGIESCNDYISKQSYEAAKEKVISSETYVQPTLEKAYTPKPSLDKLVK